MRGPVKVRSCYEAGYDGFWLHRVLAEAGIINHVIDPASLQVNRRARRAKTDRIDALGMLRALMAFQRGEDVNGGAKLVHPGGAKLVHLTLCGTRCWGVVPVSP